VLLDGVDDDKKEMKRMRIENEKKGNPTLIVIPEIGDVESAQNNAFCLPDSLLCSPHCIP
jgi:hypothetical protein